METEYRKREKKEHLKERILLGIVMAMLVVVFAAGAFFVLRHLVNETYNFAYAREYYFDRTATTKMIPLEPESWVPYYNTGNHDFQNGRYAQARDNYMMALDEMPPHESEVYEETGEDIECLIRVNLALSIVYMIDFENLHTNDREEVDQVVEQLLIARGILTAEDCAHLDTPNGHNEAAEQLKKEIDEILMRLQYRPPVGGGGGEDEQPNQSQPENGEGEDEMSRREREIERRLNDEMSDAKEEQTEQERQRERMRNYGSDGFGGYGPNPEVQSW